MLSLFSVFVPLWAFDARVEIEGEKGFPIQQQKEENQFVDRFTTCDLIYYFWFYQPSYTTFRFPLTKMEEEVDLSNFSDSWRSATELFKQRAIGAGAQLKSKVLKHEETREPYTDLDGTELTIDFAIWSNCELPDRPSKAFVLTAGIHGVEGYAGSAILCQLLQDSRLFESLPENSKIVFVHVLNPFGMCHFRRVNEVNVDLNRNFLSRREFEARRHERNRIYEKYNSFLNPKHRVGILDFFYLRTALKLLRYGFNNTKQGLAGGQSTFPKGLFYGGQILQQSLSILLKELSEEGIHANNDELNSICHLDIHTGLGPWQHDSVLCENEFMPTVQTILGDAPTENGEWHYDKLGSWVPPKEQWDKANDQVTIEEKQDRETRKGVAYSPKGHIGGGLFYRIRPKNAEFVSFTQEFGTNSGVKTIRILRAENALTHAKPTATRNARERKKLKDNFCPKSKAWRRFVLQRGVKVFEQYYEYFKG